jgi:O-methyltransferase involved in polyketide biosynthesis
MENSIFTKDGTAQGVAKQRLIESLAAADKRVINDPYAAKFVLGAGLIKLMGHRFASGWDKDLRQVFMSTSLRALALSMI